jgi:hypothetical protein
MNRIAKWSLVGLVTLVVLLCLAITFTVGWRPFFGPNARALTDRTFERTPERLERGRYIATTRVGCQYCHSPHDWSNPATPIIAGTEFSGEEEPYEGLPGRIVAPNLTPDRETGAGTWTDDQFARAIREGIGHDGRTLFPLMPYQVFREMSDEDLASVVVYLRSLPPVRHELPKTEVISPVKYLIRSAPQPVTAAVPDIPASDTVKRATYVTKLAGCEDCHTPQVKGQYVTALAFAGGFPFIGPWGSVTTANITPDASGISYYDEALFLDVLHTGRVRARVLSSIMPVMIYKNMTDDDLKLVFSYLQTVKPVKHRVDNSLPPTMCKVCQQKHGAGDQN